MQIVFIVLILGCILSLIYLFIYSLKHPEFDKPIKTIEDIKKEEESLKEELRRVNNEQKKRN